MKTRMPISAKILLLSCLNVLLLVLVFAIFIRVQYRFDLSSLLLAPGRDRILAVSRGVALQLPNTDRADWGRVLASYTAATRASACLFDADGNQQAGPPVSLPKPVLDALKRERERRSQPPVIGAESGLWRPQNDIGAGQGPRPPEQDPGRGTWYSSRSRQPPPPPPFPVFLVRTTAPTRYWVGVHVPIFDRMRMEPDETTLLWMFPSLWTNSFFFDYRPWLVAAVVVILVSGACWLPLMRGLTISVSRLTAATSAIAEGKLETRLSLRRRDELGQLSESINRMAERLSGFVHGQRRFLSDVAHELCSPIARIQVSLGILEQRAQEDQKEYVAGVQEEVSHMSGLVDQLLQFSRAQLASADTPLTVVNLRDTLDSVLDREVAGQASVDVRVDPPLAVMAHPEYLARSLGNVVRNAIRYAGDAGPIVVSARESDGVVAITIADSGPGLPESELENVFKPFYRPELARQRETGGAGLGLAIVRTCIEACGGKVHCRNRAPRGLEVVMTLAAATVVSAERR